VYDIDEILNGAVPAAGIFSLLLTKNSYPRVKS